MKTTAILMAVAMIAMVTPLSSADEECDNEAYWNEVLSTRPDNYAEPVVREHDVAKMVLGGEDAVMTEEQYEAFIADQLAALVERTEAFCMEDLVGGAAETGGFPQASEFFIIQEVAYDFGGQHCNQGENVGDGGHFEVAVPTTFGAFSWSGFATSEFTGTATSDISIASGAYYSTGVFLDANTGKQFFYGEPVSYTGVSDFWCLGFYDWFFGDYVTINLPYASGVIASA